MSVAILTVRNDRIVDVGSFGLSAPQSVKDHIMKQMDEELPQVSCAGTGILGTMPVTGHFPLRR
eukprot:scaffold187464_cov49-Attheya_sp.AAC.2